MVLLFTFELFGFPSMSVRDDGYSRNTSSTLN